MKRPGRFLLVLILVFGIVLPWLPAMKAETTVTLDFFYSATCSHCQEENAVLEQLEAEYPGLLVRRWEITENPVLYQKVEAVLQEAPYSVAAGVPLTLLGGYAFSAFDSATDPQNLENYILYYVEHPRTGIVDRILADQAVGAGDFEDLGRLVRIPLFGVVDLGEVSLWVGTVILGFFDGINPCAMWVLILLVTFLANQRDRKRMWILGSAFLAASGFAYFLIVIAWVNVSLLIGYSGWIRVALGILAMALGTWQVFRHFRTVRTEAVGCTVADAGKKRRIAARIREILSRKNLGLAVLEIVLLALSVNVLELACTPVFPAVFGNLLAFHGITGAAQAGFVALYVLFFLLDDLVVFGVAMITFRVKGISARWSKAASLVAAILLFALGFLLAFFPDILFLQF